ncbi:MAG: hypothetical protein PHX43_01695 [Alphaproteobacteria bacterium]|nr:hypothetical protein [Alphaproteobacteria bacterium]
MVVEASGIAAQSAVSSQLVKLITDQPAVAQQQRPVVTTVAQETATPVPPPETSGRGGLVDQTV